MERRGQEATMEIRGANTVRSGPPGFGHGGGVRSPSAMWCCVVGTGDMLRRRLEGEFPRLLGLITGVAHTPRVS